MDKHVISNAAIAAIITFFVYVVLILGLLTSGLLLFRKGSEITFIGTVMAITIAIGSIVIAFPMLAVSRILEKVSTYNPSGHGVHRPTVSAVKAPGIHYTFEGDKTEQLTVSNDPSHETERSEFPHLPHRPCASTLTNGRCLDNLLTPQSYTKKQG